jgi:hypothetical protein
MKTDPSSEIFKLIQTRPNDFQEIVSKCFADPILLNNLNKDVNFKDLNLVTKSALESINFGTLRYVSLQLENCDIEKSIKLEILNDNNEHLEFSQCKDYINKSGQHETISNGFIEIWYLNNHWTLWVDHDPL